MHLAFPANLSSRIVILLIKSDSFESLPNLIDIYLYVGTTICKITVMLSTEETSMILCTNNHMYKFAFAYQEVNSSN